MRMLVVTLLLTLLAICHSNSSSKQYLEVKLPDCGKVTKMTDTQRADVLRRHNTARSYIATGERGGDKDFPLTVYPKAANMSLMEYDCKLEKDADEISKKCIEYRISSFENVGSNSDSFDPPMGYLELFYIVRGWWDRHSIDLHNLTPTIGNETMIPFLQMINDGVTKIGCSYTICKRDDFNSYGVFVCKYGEPYVKPNVKIYTPGEPCSSCLNRCVGGGLCNNTVI